MKEQIEKGVELISKGDIEGALNLFELVVESNPVDHLAIYYVGLCHLKMDKVSTAVLHFNRALEIAPNTVNYLSDRAVAKLRVRDQEGSLADLDKCVELDPNYSYRYSLRAFAKNSFGDADGAIEDYIKAIELDPSDPITYNNLGLAQEAKGYQTDARKSYEKSNELSGYDPNRKAKDHTIELKKQEEKVRMEELPAEQPGTYWETIKSVFTNSEQRSEFFKFTGNLIRGNKNE